MRHNTGRFHKIIKGKIRKNLKKYISNSELIGRVGKDKVSIPIPQIDLPRFKLDGQQQGGLGQGDGQIGDPVGPGQGGKDGKAGQQEGEHMLEVEVSIDELAQILGEELELPNIQPKGAKNIECTGKKYTGIQQTGSESLRHFKRTYKRALKREIASGTFDPNKPIVIPQRVDTRYKAAKPVIDPQVNAVIIYMMDVSGSMGDVQKEIVRTESFWIDTWLTNQYKGLESRFIIHDAQAKEVDRETFFNTRESGGTIISSAYKLCKSMIEADYPVDDWNIYTFHFSDGDNWSDNDSEECIKVIKNHLLPWSNLFGYGQVESLYGSGEFIEVISGAFKDEDRVIASEISNKDDIVKSIKEFLGKGY